MSNSQSNLNTPKGQPKATPEVAQMLGLRMDTHATPQAPEQKAPEGLPIVDAESSHVEATAPETTPAIEHPSVSEHNAVENENYSEDIYEQEKNRSFLKTALPYIAIFVVGIFLYYFYFSTFSFTTITNLFKQKASTVTTQIASTAKNSQQSALDQLKANNLPAYYTYMSQFYFDTSDKSVTDPDADNSHNGLTNFQKFILNLNPKVYDTLGNGQPDSQVLAAGIDPATGQTLTGKRKDLVDNYIDLEVANNKLTEQALQNPGQASTSNSGVGQVAGASVIGVRNAGATSAGVITSASAQAPAQATARPSVHGAFTAPPTGPTLSGGLPGQQSALGINDAVNASLNIPSLKITVPIVWTKSTKDFDQDLKTGVVHYPGTAMPGEIGTAYISGHSSNYAWVKGSYNEVFDTLDRQKPGDTFTITVTLKNGNKAVLHYKVFKQQQYQPNDQAQLDNGSKSVVALSTCWPVGTTARRLVDFGELTQVDK